MSSAEVVSDPHNIIGKDIKAADRSDFGCRIMSYNPGTENYTAQAIRWSTSEYIGLEWQIDQFKITYRYDLKTARQNKVCYCCHGKGECSGLEDLDDGTVTVVTGRCRVCRGTGKVQP